MGRIKEKHSHSNRKRKELGTSEANVEKGDRKGRIQRARVVFLVLLASSVDRRGGFFKILYPAYV